MDDGAAAVECFQSMEGANRVNDRGGVLRNAGSSLGIWICGRMSGVDRDDMRALLLGDTLEGQINFSTRQ